MWTYSSTTGRLLNPSGTLIATCYSGRGAGLNNPAMENVKCVGPIPRGSYKIGPAYTHPTEGPIVMNLEPIDGTDTFGRSEFHIHGDNQKQNHSASLGCIIAPRFARQLISASTDKELEVQ
jgi:hypothetical protein